MKEDSRPSCLVCGEESTFVFRAIIRTRHDVAYFQCRRCGFVQTEKPYWLDEAYEHPINLTDTGLLRRCATLADTASILLPMFAGRRGYFLDFAGGYGVFTRMMRDRGFDFHWTDPYCANLFARGFEHTGEKADAVTLFEAMEHFSNPLESLATAAAEGGTLLCSTTLIRKDRLPDPDWWYWGREHGQHISFYTSESLAVLAKKLGRRLSTDGKFLHMFAPQRVPGWVLRAAYLASRLGLGGILTAGLPSKTQSDSRLLLEKKP